MNSAAKLAINGGTPARRKPFPAYNTIGDEEKRAVAEVLDTGVLSKFLGTWSEEFFGGPRVQKLERDWENLFGVKHAVSVNSATSGLIAAVGAAGIGPGDEVIVSPYTMSASATCVLFYGAVPVFADIEPETFCISAESIEPHISSRTKAIIVVDLFGQPAEMRPIMELARNRGLIVIEDAAQAPGAKYFGQFAGTLADIGVFSLNRHKIIHTGEGGVNVTNDSGFAERMQLIRNHGEAVVKEKGVANIVNLLGFNFRMTEIEAAIGCEQLKKLPALLAKRQQVCQQLSQMLAEIPGVIPPTVRHGATHAYYLFPVRYDENELGVPRKIFCDAVRAEGIPIYEGYVEPLYLAPLYQQRIALGKNGYPFANSTVSYQKGICPIAERMHERELFILGMCHSQLTKEDLDDVVSGIRKVAQYRDELRSAALA